MKPQGWTAKVGCSMAVLFFQKLYDEASSTAEEHKLPFAVTFLCGSAAL